MPEEAFEALRVSGISLGNESVDLTFSAWPGKTYRLQFKNDLDDLAWTDSGESFVANSSSITLTGIPSENGKRFYRVAELY